MMFPAALTLARCAACWSPTTIGGGVGGGGRRGSATHIVSFLRPSAPSVARAGPHPRPHGLPESRNSAVACRRRTRPFHSATPARPIRRLRQGPSICWAIGAVPVGVARRNDGRKEAIARAVRRWAAVRLPARAMPSFQRVHNLARPGPIFERTSVLAGCTCVAVLRIFRDTVATTG